MIIESIVARCSLALCMLAPATTTPNGPPLASTIETRQRARDHWSTGALRRAARRKPQPVVRFEAETQLTFHHTAPYSRHGVNTQSTTHASTSVPQAGQAGPVARAGIFQSPR